MCSNSPPFPFLQGTTHLQLHVLSWDSMSAEPIIVTIMLSIIITYSMSSELTGHTCAELVTIAAALARPPFLDLEAAGRLLEQLPPAAGSGSLEALRGKCHQCLANPFHDSRIKLGQLGRRARC